MSDILTTPFVSIHGRGIYIAPGIRLYAMAPSGDPVRIDAEVRDADGGGLVLIAKREYEALHSRALYGRGGNREAA